MQHMPVLAVSSVFLLITTSACRPPAPDVSADEAAIRAIGAAGFEAETRRDIDATLAPYVDDALFQPEGAPAFRGKAAMRAMYEALFKLPYKAITGTVDTVHMASSGDLAVAIGANAVVADGPSGETRTAGKYMAVLRKIDGTWKLLAISFNSDAPAAQPQVGAAAVSTPDTR